MKHNIQNLVALTLTAVAFISQHITLINHVLSLLISLMTVIYLAIGIIKRYKQLK